jgi:hypothetical protein
MPNKPYVKKDNINPEDKFPNKQKGGLIISADFEMSWAFRYSKRTKNFIEKGREERRNFPFILKLLDDYQIPITWATVGHLFLEECKHSDHSWMTPVPHYNDHWKFTEGNWFDHDPYSNYKEAPEWYAPDLIKQIIDSPINHEIGCHTFSHIDCTYKNCPPQVLDDELQACKDVAKNFSVNFSSLVFPGGTAGNYEVLKKHNFKIYRKNIEFELAYPFRDEFGMLVTPTSSAIADNGLGWSKEYLIYRFKKYINKAIKTNTIAHFWFHPSIDQFSLNQILPEVLEYAAKKRESGQLWIGTMDDIVKHIEEKQIL